MPPQHVLPDDVAFRIVAVELNKTRRHGDANASRRSRDNATATP